ncbi:MAG: branched-chain amino acid ABC transporter permease [Clostridia bacterium]|nr:branched-chain amino acid ABC transporter permease [Clostridia bacterium]
MKKISKTTKSNFITYALVIVAFIFCQIWLKGVIPGFKMGKALRGQMVPICVYIVMAISLNLVVGISGELSLGHAGFMSVGAFTGAVASAWLLGAFAMENEILRLIIAMLMGGCIAAIAGVIIGVPVLRLRGDYLAIVTLAFGEIIKNVMNCMYFSLDGGRLYVAFNDPSLPGKMLIDGPKGTKGVSTIASFGMGFALIIVTLIVVLNLINSRSGRAIMAIRDNRIAAESVGLNITKYKMMAFVTSSAICGMAGALYGLNYSSVVATKFNFNTSILVLVFVVLGGIGNIRGSIIAAALLTILPELLREFADYRMLVYAIVLILVMLATNNPKLRLLIDNIVGKIKGGKHSAKEADKA